MVFMFNNQFGKQYKPFELTIFYMIALTHNIEVTQSPIVKAIMFEYRLKILYAYIYIYIYIHNIFEKLLFARHS